MVTFNSVVLFVMIWWVMLFAVLPWGVRPTDQTENPARWNGAPARPLMGRKLIATTVLAIVLWLGAQYALRQGWADFHPVSASVTGE